jgi:hypothetical protein
VFIGDGVQKLCRGEMRQNWGGSVWDMKEKGGDYKAAENDQEPRTGVAGRTLYRAVAMKSSVGRPGRRRATDWGGCREHSFLEAGAQRSQRGAAQDPKPLSTCAGLGSVSFGGT